MGSPNWIWRSACNPGSNIKENPGPSEDFGRAKCRCGSTSHLADLSQLRLYFFTRSGALDGVLLGGFLFQAATDCKSIGFRSRTGLLPIPSVARCGAIFS